MFRQDDSASATLPEAPNASRPWSRPGPATAGPEQKARGAYYTDPSVAEFLVRWAVRAPGETVLEPCFGGGVFLASALQRLHALGESPRALVGVEQEPAAWTAAAETLAVEAGPSPELVNADFFEIDHQRLGRHTAVVGNPPFIRYQRFNGERRARALARAAERGVSFTRLASAWAPFVVHATSFLKPGGRLAMVAPAELCHAAYARPVLQLLARDFARVRILTFARRLFPHLNEDTVLILADAFGSGGGDLRLIALADGAALRDARFLEDSAATPIVVHEQAPVAERFSKYLLPARTRELYDELARRPDVARLGALAAVGIGYVTGNNEFFHLTAAEARARRVPAALLRRAVCRSAWLAGVRFTARDWTRLDQSGLRTRLLALSGQASVPECVRTYVSGGRRRGVHRAYKCRVREPWWAVPGVQAPEMLLTYMANERPLLAVNEVRAVAPNTLLCVRRRRQAPAAEAFVTAWATSLSGLSAEIEGHSLGGGMLKLEPGEAAQVLLPMPAGAGRDEARALAEEIDRLVRAGAQREALDLADRQVLGQGLGLGEAERQLLREGARALAERRRRR